MLKLFQKILLGSLLKQRWSTESHVWCSRTLKTKERFSRSSFLVANDKVHYSATIEIINNLISELLRAWALREVHLRHLNGYNFQDMTPPIRHNLRGIFYLTWPMTAGLGTVRECLKYPTEKIFQEVMIHDINNCPSCKVCWFILPNLDSRID